MLYESLDEIYPFSRITPKSKTAVFDEWEFEVSGVTHVLRFLRTNRKTMGPRVSVIDFGIRRGKQIRRKIENVPDIKKYLATVLRIVEEALENPTRELKTKMDGFGILMQDKVFDKMGSRFSRVIRRRFIGKFDIHRSHFDYGEIEDGVKMIYASKIGRGFSTVFPGVDFKQEDPVNPATTILKKQIKDRIDRIKTDVETDKIDEPPEDLTINEPEVSRKDLVTKLTKKYKKSDNKVTTVPTPVETVKTLEVPKNSEPKPLAYKIQEAKKMGGIDIKTSNIGPEKAFERFIYETFYKEMFSSNKEIKNIIGEIPKFNIDHMRSSLKYKNNNDFLSNMEYGIALNVSGIKTNYIYDMFGTSYSKATFVELTKKGISTEKLKENLPDSAGPATWERILQVANDAENITKGLGIDLTDYRGKYPFDKLRKSYVDSLFIEDNLSKEEKKQLIFDIIASSDPDLETKTEKYSESSKGKKQVKSVDFKGKSERIGLSDILINSADTPEEYIQLNEMLPDYERTMILTEDPEVFENNIIDNWTMVGSNMTQYVANKVLSDFGINKQLNDFYNFEAKRVKGTIFDDVIDLKKDDIVTKFENLYNRNQNFYKNKFGKKYEKKTLKLYRGVGINVVDKYIPGAIESWTANVSVAKLFGEMMSSRNEPYTILYAEVPIQHIFGCFESFYDFWPGEEDLKGKKEYIVMGGTFASTPLYVFDTYEKKQTRELSSIREWFNINENRNDDMKKVKIITPSMKNFEKDLKSKKTAKGNDPKENEVRKSNYEPKKN